MHEITFEDFVRGAGRSGGQEVFEPSGMKLYVRRSIRILDGFELAAINVPEEKQHQGILSRFLAQHSGLPLKIENVLNPNLEAWLLCHHDWEVENALMLGISASFVNTSYRRAYALRSDTQTLEIMRRRLRSLSVDGGNPGEPDNHQDGQTDRS